MLGAASELRAALASGTHDRAGWAAAEVIGSRFDLPVAVSQLQLATAAAIDVAYLSRDIALSEPTLTAPARAIAMRTQADVEHSVDQGESRYLGIDWVTAGDVRVNRTIPIPDPVRRGLVDTADQVIAAAGPDAAAAATLVPSERAEPAQAVSGSMPSRPAQTPRAPIPIQEGPGPSR